jgi:BlaI family transcriptional regulator, penicillinase repressor
MSRFLKNPTEAQLHILRVLWNRGPLDVASITRELSRSHKTHISSVWTHINAMKDCGLVRVTPPSKNAPHASRSTVFAAEITERESMGGFIRSISRKFFRGSVDELLVAVIKEGNYSAAELAALQKLIDDANENRKPTDGTP